MRRAQRGFTYVELIIVAAILGIVLGMGVPKASLAFEEARVDEAVSTLESIWRAQRMYWLETATYSDELAELVAQELLDDRLEDDQGAFTYAVTAAGASTYTATATRINSGWWSGMLTLDETGEITGTISNGAGHDVQPAGS